MYHYEYPHPAVSTDVVAFTVIDQSLRVLVIRRDAAPFKSYWALPGGFVRIDEGLEAAAYRVLNEKTPLKHIYIEQLQTVGEPHRDPRERVISVVYMAIIPSSQIEVDHRTLWQTISDSSPLAFDHSSIIMLARQRLRSKLQYSSIAFRFLPVSFTLTDAQMIYEVILGENLEKRNFRKQLLARNILKATGQMSQGSAHRPAQLYTLKQGNGLSYW